MRCTLLLLVVLIGCRPALQKELSKSFAGTWESAGGQITTINLDKSFKAKLGPITLDGTWNSDGRDITLTPILFNQRPIAEMKAFFLRNSEQLPGGLSRYDDGFIENIDVPNVMTISDDGNTLKTNPKKDKNNGPPTTLVRS